MIRNEKYNLFSYITGQFISLLGSGIQNIALPLYILSLTGSTAKMGIFSFAISIPLILFSPLGGYLGDIFNRKKIMYLTDFGQGFILLILTWVISLGISNFWILFITQFICSTLSSLFNSASSAIIGDIVSDDYINKAITIEDNCYNISNLTAPLIGGVLYTILGIKFVIMMNAFSFIISGIFEFCISYNPKHLEENTAFSFGGFVSNTKNIFSIIKGSKSLIDFMLLLSILNFIVGPLFKVLFPYGFNKVIGFSVNSYSMLNSIFFVGLILGNFIVLRSFQKRSNSSIMRNGMIGIVVSMLLYCGSFLLFFLGIHNHQLLFALFALSNIFFAIMNTYCNTPLYSFVQKNIPANIRSSFSSTVFLVGELMKPLSALIAGVMLESVHIYFYFAFVTVLGILSLKFLKVDLESVPSINSVEASV